MKSFYGTEEYIDEYFKDYSDRINLVQLVTGETILGFVFDDLYKNKTQVAYPFIVEYRPDYNAFNTRPYSIELETPAVTFNDHAIVSIMRPKHLEIYKDAVKLHHVTITAVKGNDTVH